MNKTDQMMNLNLEDQNKQELSNIQILNWCVDQIHHDFYIKLTVYYNQITELKSLKQANQIRKMEEYITNILKKIYSIWKNESNYSDPKFYKVFIKKFKSEEIFLKKFKPTKRDTYSILLTILETEKIRKTYLKNEDPDPDIQDVELI